MSVSKSIFANSHYVSVWLAETTKTMQANPGDKKALNVHFAMTKLHELFNENSQSSLASLEKRHQIFDYINTSATEGDPRAMFFLGLCYLEGFGCVKNARLGNNLIEVSAIWRKCDLALNYINLFLGLSYIYGNKQQGIKANLYQGAKHLLNAGAIATPTLGSLMQHIKTQERSLAAKGIKYKKPMLVMA